MCLHGQNWKSHMGQNSASDSYLLYTACLLHSWTCFGCKGGNNNRVTSSYTEKKIQERRLWAVFKQPKTYLKNNYKAIHVCTWGKYIKTMKMEVGNDIFPGLMYDNNHKKLQFRKNTFLFAPICILVNDCSLLWQKINCYCGCWLLLNDIVIHSFFGSVLFSIQISL